MAREYLMLAQTYRGQDINSWLMSEKLDGMRAFWDGGISKGHVDCPWSNDPGVVATGLWSRYGKVIHAHPDWLRGLPNFPLDGELYLGCGRFQEVMSICRRDTPDVRWEKIRFFVFDSPAYDQFFTTGRINNLHCKMEIVHSRCMPWASGRHEPPREAFVRKAKWLMDLDYTYVVPVEQLSVSGSFDEHLDAIIQRGGEGLMFRNPFSFWHPTRSPFLLKHKPFLDAEGIIVDFKWGEGKHHGRLGSISVRFDGPFGPVTFDLSGFTDEERRVNSIPPNQIDSRYFTRGEVITFKYRTLTDDGIPKEARYWRKYC